MLVLSRQRDETIMIGDDVEITIVDIRGDKVRLGITAPTRIAVHRKEVYEAIKQENQRAAKINGSEVDSLGQAVGTPGVKGDKSRFLRQNLGASTRLNGLNGNEHTGRPGAQSA